MASPSLVSRDGSPLKPRDDQIDVYGLTHPGRIRTENQDHFLVCALEKRIRVYQTSLEGGDDDGVAVYGDRMAFLAMVADGVGSRARGERASRLAVQTVTRYVAETMRWHHDLDASDDEPFIEALQDAARQCHASVVEEGEGDGQSRGMATTLTLWLGVWPRAYLLQVGDSRFYRFQDDTLTKISRDQTVAQALVDDGVISNTAAAGTRWAGVLSSSIGGHESQPVVTRLDQDWGAIGLLCSDGLTKHVSEERIAERLRGISSSRLACEQLLQDALDGGGTDNITIIVGRAVGETH